MGKTARAVCAGSAETQGRVSLDCESERRVSARTCQREPGKSRSGNGGSCFGTSRNQGEPKVRHFVPQNAALVTTTRTGGARVVLTLPVARKRLRGGAGLGGAQPGSWRFLRTSERGKAGTAIEKKPRGKNSGRIARCACKCRRKLCEVFGGVGRSPCGGRFENVK